MKTRHDLLTEQGRTIHFYSMKIVEKPVLDKKPPLGLEFFF